VTGSSRLQSRDLRLRSVHGHLLPCLNGRQARERKRRMGNRAGRQGNKGDLVIIARDAVGMNRPARAAAMKYRPVAAGPRPDGYRFHPASALGCPVAGFLIYVPTPQAPRTMVPMLRAKRFRDDRITAMNTVKPFGFLVATLLR
jgi:hypothetical protein